MTVMIQSQAINICVSLKALIDMVATTPIEDPVFD
jgi:hypothetical protein